MPVPRFELRAELCNAELFAEVEIFLLMAGLKVILTSNSGSVGCLKCKSNVLELFLKWDTFGIIRNVIFTKAKCQN